MSLSKATINLVAWLFTLCFTGMIVAGAAAVLVYQHYARDLPAYNQLANYDPPTVTRLYAADGRLLAEYATEKRIFVPLAAIPRRVQQAFISAEDKNFYQHTGVDFTGVARAIYTNVINYGHGKSLVGGSTITQQVVKNFLLTDEKSIERKAKEAILAMRISQAYSKDKILELYLNEIYLGLRSYGVAAAALNYFNKSLDELNVEETALLAAMPKAPSSYDPRKNYDGAKQRRDWVIHRMQEDGFITPQEETAAVAAPITLRARDAEEVTHADFFAEEVRRWLGEKYGQNVLYEGGLVVKTTLDPALQRMADKGLRAALITYDRRRGYRGALKHGALTGWQERLKDQAKLDNHLIEGQRLAAVTAMDDKRATLTFDDGKTGTLPIPLLKWTRRVIADGVLGAEPRKPSDVLALGDIVIAGPLAPEQRKLISDAESKTAWDLQQVPAVNGAFVALDPHTGKVLAMSGGYAYGGTEFNRATQARRQPGSSFKPFVYLSGLESGLTPSSVFLDAPVEMSQGQGLPAWKPQNHENEYLGPTTLRVGLERSRNTITVRIGQAIGIDRVLEVGKRFGVYDEVPRNFSIVLGAAETSLLRLANAYAMIVNGGKKVAPALVERIDDRHGRTIFRRDTRSCAGCAITDASTINPDTLPPIPADTREQVVDPRVAYQMVSMMEGVVQRGTGVRAKAVGKPLAGKTGTTNESRDTWFVGFSPDLVAGVFVGYDRPQTLGKKETGASVALPAFVSFMKDALADKPATPFRTPRGVQLVRVDLKTGTPAQEPSPGSKIIQEAFLSGDPVWLPPSAQDAAAKSPQIAPPAEPGAAVVGEEGLPQPVQVPAPTHGGDRPVVGTGGLY